ncbi:hypothetical protein Pcinc_025339 [Petrolisthes cinctipes]|uniref:Major facilitator superfamily (MFS) profile domain-containing protein n=1 Tax=Petrolisthes cinctipes TaxID=88211 RepID=A0AAE1F872_PETCI|nr:hypothetical protein Pcinc_025339 [Petrolisthes cinctipes]
MEDDSDTLLTKLGTGKWTIIYCLVLSIWFFILPMHTMAGAFMAPFVEHTCRQPPDAYMATTTTYTLDSNYTTNSNGSLPLPNFDASCNYLVEESDGRLVEEPCTDWDFDNSTFTSTVTSEFQLVCGRKYLRATYQSMYMIGMLVGAGSTAFFADRFGRWLMIAISTVIYTVIAFVTAWLPNFPSILAARFLLGTMHPASLMAGFILVLEVTEMKMRSLTGLMLFTSWGIGTIMFSGMAYLVRAWRWLQLVASLPGLLFIFLLCILGESPRWLAVVGQHQRALKEYKRAAAWNKVTLPPDHEILEIMLRVQQQAVSTRKPYSSNKSLKSIVRNILHDFTVLIRTSKVRLVTLVMCVDYLVGAMLFFGLTLGASALGVDPFLYMAISGIMELPSTTILIPITNYFGRKKVLFINYGISAVVLLTQPFISNDLKWLSVTLVMIGKFASANAFNLVFLYSLELFPTEIRSQGMNVAMAASRVGGIIAPYLINAVDSTYPWISSVLFGAGAAVAGLALLPLWETINTRLPDTVADLEGFTDPLQSPAVEEEEKLQASSGEDPENKKSNLPTPC